MTEPICQTVALPAPAERLFEMYLDPEIHAAITGAEVRISAEPGSEFQAFGGVLSGRMLYSVRPRLIVQSWRSSQFKAEDPDSTLVLSFAPDGDLGRIALVHINVPEHDYQGVTSGWEKYYWEPWRRYLQESQR